MSETFLPWDFYPDLTKDNLGTVAGIMRDVREKAVDVFDPDEGDSTWSLGCTIYSRTLKKMRDASLQFQWLRILPERENLRFTFAIGNVPVKFFKGAPEDLPAKSLARSWSELRQQRLALDLRVIESGERILRFAVEPNAKNRTAAIWLVESDEEGFIFRVYEIPRASGNLVVMPTHPIDLPPLALQPLEILNNEKKVVGETFDGDDNPNTGS